MPAEAVDGERMRLELARTWLRRRLDRYCSFRRKRPRIAASDQRLTPTTPRRKTPRLRQLRSPSRHWRFGRADLVGDGLTAFVPLGEAIEDLDVCGARALVAVGMASSQGPSDVNERLAQCRAEQLASIIRAAAQECAAEPPRVFTLNLGRAASPVERWSDRRALVLALDTETDLDEASAARLDPIVEAHSGAWRLAEFAASGSTDCP